MRTATRLRAQDEKARAEKFGSSARKPSPAQVYKVAHMMVDLLGLDWPQTSAQASELIQRLQAQADALSDALAPQDVNADPVPF